MTNKKTRRPSKKNSMKENKKHPYKNKCDGYGEEKKKLVDTIYRNIPIKCCKVCCEKEKERDDLF